jgi:protein tyrosine/serine phosphatase
MTTLNREKQWHFRVWLTALAAMLVLTGMAVSRAQNNPSQNNLSNSSIENFGRVNENYYRGSQPTGEEFAQLKALGIKTVIDLRRDSEHGVTEQVQRLGMHYINIPLRSSKPASDEQTTYFLKLVNDPQNWPVYVHCKGGRHRTGALTAVYRMTHDGWTADRAFEEMKQYDFNNGLFGGPREQRKFVYSFYEKYRVPTGQK